VLRGTALAADFLHHLIKTGSMPKNRAIPDGLRPT
jgi:hypothetical protein